MAALTSDRFTDRKLGGRENLRNFPVAAATQIYKGALVALNSSGNLVPGSASTTLTAVGTALENINNSAGLSGALRCEVSTAPAGFVTATGGGDDIAGDDIGAACFIVDDQTVALTDGTGTRSPAGTVFDIGDSGEVFVLAPNV
jgi:hypothetical protein